VRIFGLDFTSAPSARKPISCAACELQGAHLRVQTIGKLSSFAAFEAFLHNPGPWLAACDFPFAQPARLLSNLGWPTRWEEYMPRIEDMSKEAFEDVLLRYRSVRAPGDKQHLRAVDRSAGACSPMMLQRVPVGKMFYQGAPRLLAAGVSILPCHPTSDTRIVFEGYPALVARRWIGRRSYKSDERSKQTQERAQARRALVDGLCSAELRERYGLALALSPAMREALVSEAMGDDLDAVLCAIQAAWAYTQREQGYGIPADCKRDEGWIVDPAMAHPRNVATRRLG
jgi:Protein of unknown function (DUF429)